MRTPNTFRKKALSAIAQKSRKICHAVIEKSGCQRAMRLAVLVTACWRSGWRMMDVVAGRGEDGQDGGGGGGDVPGDEACCKNRSSGRHDDPAGSAVPAGEEGELVLPLGWCEHVFVLAKSTILVGRAREPQA